MVCNKKTIESLIKAGMRFADSPRAVAAASDIVFSIVTDAAAVREIALGPDGVIAGLKPPGIYVDMSTIAPDVSRAVAAEFTAKRPSRIATHRLRFEIQILPKPNHGC